MSFALYFLIPVAVLAVAGVLILGLLNMARGGSPERSQDLMRWRVILQAVALFVMMGALYFAGSRH
jgi:Na+/H+ antiporter NhaD/arsenite permease-like protein